MDGATKFELDGDNSCVYAVAVPVANDPNAVLVPNITVLLESRLGFTQLTVIDWGPEPPRVRCTLKCIYSSSH